MNIKGLLGVCALVLLGILGACDDLAGLLGSDEEPGETQGGEVEQTPQPTKTPESIIVHTPIRFQPNLSSIPYSDAVTVYAISQSAPTELFLNGLELVENRNGDYVTQPIVNWPTDGQKLSFLSLVNYNNDVKLSAFSLKQGVLWGVVERTDGVEITKPLHYSYALSVSDTTTPVTLDYKNALSTIRVNLSNANELPIQVNEITLHNYLLSASVNAFSDKAFLFEASESYASTPLLLNYVSSSNATQNTYMLPQVLSAHPVTMQINYTINGIAREVNYNLSEFNKQWLSGELYQYNIEIQEDAIDINITVENFNDAGSSELMPLE